MLPSQPRARVSHESFPAPRHRVGDEEFHSNCPAESNQPLRRQPLDQWLPVATRCYFARSMYSPVVGFTRTFSPTLMNSGTFTVTPLSSFAGFVDAVFVAVFMTGAVSTTSSVSVFGS